MEAMGMGKPCISNAEGGPLDMFKDGDNHYGMLVPNYPEPAFGCIETFGDLNTGWENVRNPNISTAMAWMRKIYEDKVFYKEMSEKAINRSYDFTHQKVGEIFTKILC